jgi:osmoprotectant transport system ATP-binding protein
MTQDAGATAAVPDAAAQRLEAVDVVKRYGETVALDRVSLVVESGESLALVGESGSGKTTLLRCFNRMVDPDAGAVRLGGRDAQTLDPIGLRRRIGYVQQEGGLMPHWSVLRNAALVPWLRGDADASDRARAALDMVGLPAEAYGDRRPSELSGGQRQRVAIARALASNPGVLLMDEPFGALDALTRAELHDAFSALRGEVRATVLLVTHDLQEAALLADRLAVLHGGRLEQVADAETLVRAPATDYVRRLVTQARLGVDA